MGRLIVLLALIAAVWWFLRWFRRTPPHQVSAVLRKVLLWGGVGLVVLAVISGRLNPIFAAIAAMIPVVMRLLNLLQMLPALRRLMQSLGLAGAVGGIGGQGGASGAGGSSTIRTRYLNMTLDHVSGAMDGGVLEGPFAGQRLSDLRLDQLLRMLELYQESDARSAAVLTAYLDREHGEDWRERAGSGREGGSHGPGSGQHAAVGAMTREDAWSILGLDPGASADAVRAAHRRLMQRLHPDRGGSDYLAAQINAAKDLLLGE